MLEKIENDLEKAYENIEWEERKTLLDNINTSFWKGEISLDEFEKSVLYLKKSCPEDDADKWNKYWSGEGAKFTNSLADEVIKEKICRYFYQGMMLEMFLNLTICCQGINKKLDLIGDNFFHSIEDYQRVKEELCRHLRYYGLTAEQEQIIMQSKSLADNVELILGLPKSKEPNNK